MTDTDTDFNKQRKIYLKRQESLYFKMLSVLTIHQNIKISSY